MTDKDKPRADETDHRNAGREQSELDRARDWHREHRAEDFHAFANVTQRILWQGVVAVRRARSSIADSTRSCEPVLSPAARRREGTSPLPTCARRGLRKENRAMATDDADDLVPFQEVRVIRSTAP